MLPVSGHERGCFMRGPALRGHDAVHCACAQQLIAPDLVAATGDRKRLDTWHALGVATYDVNQT